MKNLKLILAIAMMAIMAVSCSKNEENPKPPVESKKASNINGSKAFAKFSFKEGKVVTGNNWDIAFYSTYIIVNGGTKVTDDPRLKIAQPIRSGNGAIALQKSTFGSVLVAPSDSEFKQDVAKTTGLPTGNDKGWYHYSGAPKHLITPISGRVIVVKTHNGHYAKLEILSYYKDNKPGRNTGRHYTFNYVYNPNKGDKSLK